MSVRVRVVAIQNPATAHPTAATANPSELSAKPSVVFDQPRISIGRSVHADVRLPDRRISVRHCQIEAKGQRYQLTDLGSTAGTYVDGQRLAPRRPRTLGTSAQVQIGPVLLAIETGAWTSPAAVAAASHRFARSLGKMLSDAPIGAEPHIRVLASSDEAAVSKTVPLNESGEERTIGRSERCDLQINDDDLSRHHASVRWQAGQAVVEDANSKNGTWVQGTRRNRFRIRSGDSFSMGSTRLIFEDPLETWLSEVAEGPDESFRGEISRSQPSMEREDLTPEAPIHERGPESRVVERIVYLLAALLIVSSLLGLWLLQQR